MKNVGTHTLALLIAVFLLNCGLKAQNLVVTLIDSNIETFSISNILSIKFGSNTMILNELNGTQTIWDIDDIDNYAFDDATNLNEAFSIVKDELSIFPNPATNKVSIAFKSNLRRVITIDIIDANGRTINQVYKGEHQNEQEYIWNSSVQPGVYYCRISTENKVTTKPIVIQ